MSPIKRLFLLYYGDLKHENVMLFFYIGILKCPSYIFVFFPSYLLYEDLTWSFTTNKFFWIYENHGIENRNT